MYGFNIFKGALWKNFPGSALVTGIINSTCRVMGGGGVRGKRKEISNRLRRCSECSAKSIKRLRGVNPVNYIFAIFDLSVPETTETIPL